MFVSIVSVIFPILVLVAGLILLVFSSDTAVEHSVSIATALGTSPIIIGLVLVSIGTDLPEVVNSILASQMGHGDINVGDSLGSILAQVTLVLGLVPFFVGKFKVNKKEVLIVGAAQLLSIILVLAVVEKGYITRLNGLFLIVSWILLIIIVNNLTNNKTRSPEKNVSSSDKRYFYHFRRAALGFAGVAIGAYFVIESVIALSELFNIPEYTVSFFAVAIGTSLPELFVNVAAAKKNQFELAIGNTLGSCIFDACFSIGIGPLFFPISLSVDLVMLTGVYALLGSLIVILTLAFKEKVNRKIGLFFIAIYLLSYILLSI
ncbi:MAG: sodium:calcium antiporter [archaeon]